MTQEDKELLLKDLCARLPYKIAIEDEYGDTLYLDYKDVHLENYVYKILEGNIKPYLFPMSSMTEEQKKELSSFDPFKTDEVKTLGDWAICLVEFYNKHHFDYYGLIPKGLANDATGLNIY